MGVHVVQRKGEVLGVFLLYYCTVLWVKSINKQTSTPVIRTGIHCISPHADPRTDRRNLSRLSKVKSMGTLCNIRYVQHRNWCRSCSLSHVVRDCLVSLSHLANDRPMHYRCFTFWPWGLTSGPKFTKLCAGLQQTPLRHPAEFQPDCTNGLRDVFPNSSIFGLGR